MIAMTFVAAAEEHIDKSHSWIWPEGYELLFGSIASSVPHVKADFQACLRTRSLFTKYASASLFNDHGVRQF